MIKINDASHYLRTVLYKQVHYKQNQILKAYATDTGKRKGAGKKKVINQKIWLISDTNK